MIFGHGWQKLVTFPDQMHSFPDPIGLGSTFALVLAVFSEFFCSIALALGILTRFAAVPLFVTMFVAATIVQNQDPFSKKELAVIYGLIYFTLICVGGGKYSFDRLILKRN